MGEVTALNPPIRYFGGKSGMKNEILKHFPKKGSYNVYVEPFGGSAALLFANPDPPPVEIYNDLYQNVYSLFKVLSDAELFPQFKRLCDLCYASRQLRDEYEEQLKNETLSVVERAFRYWYVNRMSYSGSGGFSVNLSVRRGMSKTTSDFLSTVDNLENIHQRLSRVVIENVDGVELIRKYNSTNVFMYCDPPYHPSTRSSGRYQVDMDDEKHLEYLNALVASNAKLLVSGYKCEQYEVLENNGFERIDFEVKTVDTRRNPKTKTESLWKRY